MNICVAGEIMMLVSHMTEICHGKEYAELSMISQNEICRGTKSAVGNAHVSIQKNMYNNISGLHTNMDMSKGSTYTHRDDRLWMI
jgi:hypothetical protein